MSGRYRAPDHLLVAQGTWTSRQLAALATSCVDDPYAQAGFDTAATARELEGATGSLGAALTTRVVAEAWLSARHGRARRLVQAAHRWEIWLRGVWRAAVADGVPLALSLERLRPPTVGRLIVRLDRLLPDLTRQRALFEARAPAELLDRGPAFLTALRSEDLVLRERTSVRDAAVRDLRAARDALVDALRRHDEQVRTVERLTGRTPVGAARAFLPVA